MRKKSIKDYLREICSLKKAYYQEVDLQMVVMAKLLFKLRKLEQNKEKATIPYAIVDAAALKHNAMQLDLLKREKMIYVTVKKYLSAMALLPLMNALE